MFCTGPFNYDSDIYRGHPGRLQHAQHVVVARRVVHGQHIGGEPRLLAGHERGDHEARDENSRQKIEPPGEHVRGEADRGILFD